MKTQLMQRLRRRGLFAVVCLTAALSRPVAPSSTSSQVNDHGSLRPAIATGTTPDGRAVPKGLQPSDWAGIRGAYERHRHQAVPVAGEPHQWQARNPGQQWQTRFDARGFQIAPQDGGWTWGLELLRYGVAGLEREMGSEARVRADRERVTYGWDAVVDEWFVDDARGLEHGFTLQRRPAGGAGPVVLWLGVRGGLQPRIQKTGTGVFFVDAHEASVVTYTGLTVVDADHRTVAARFEAAGADLRLVVEDEGARYPLTIDPLAQQAYLKASNTGAGDSFGSSVAVSGDTVVVGAYTEASAATGVNGDETDNSAPNAGAAYVFTRSGGVWSQEAYLKASNTDAGDFFGREVVVSGDTVVVGAFWEGSNATGVNGNQADNSAGRAGAAYVFTRSAGTWTQQAYLKASNGRTFLHFGESVAVSGETVVVGAIDDSSSATGVNGDEADHSAGIAGAAYVFTRSGTTWSQQADPKASNTDGGDRFGCSIAVSGDTVVVGANGEKSNATGVNGDQLNNSLDRAGAAYVFTRSGGTWSQQAYLKASNPDALDFFGESVAVSGDTVVVGAFREASKATGVDGNQADNSADDAGAAYVFARSGSTWSQQAYLKASNTDVHDQFGETVAVSGDTVVVGERWGGGGAAYVFARSGSTWSQQAYLKASNNGHNFGTVAVSGDTVVVGATAESSGATGVNGDQTDNSAVGAGAAYTFIVDLPQTITFGALDPKTFGDAAFDVSATGGGSGNAVTFSSDTPGTCSVLGTSVTIEAAGPCTIAANQAGDSNYLAALQVTQSFTAVPANQTITFGPLGGKVFGDAPFVAGGTGGNSGNAVTFSSDTPGTCSVVGTTVMIEAAGTCTIAANQAGTVNYHAAPPVTQSFTIDQANQAIAFGALGGKVFGDAPFDVSATGGNSGNAVTFSSQTLGVCTVSGSTVTIVTAGTCTIAADQASAANYNAAPQVTRTFTVARANQTITFSALGGKTFGDAPFTVSATSTSSLAVTAFSSLTTGVCTVSGNQVTIVTAGLCTVAADQPGNGNYNAASQATLGVAIAKANQTITFGPLGSKLIDDLPFPIGAAATSTLAVTFASQTPGVCTVSGSTVTLVALGTCTIAADQAGNGNYNAAASVTRSFTVAPNCAIVSVGPTQLSLGVVGLPYSQTFGLAGGPAPASFTIAGALPAGLTFSNGTISGTPAARGAFSIAITGTDANACQATVSVSLAVGAERRLVVGAGVDGPATVRAFTVASPILMADFTAFASPFTGGVSVAQGDVNGDGVADIITGAGPGASPTVAVFEAGGAPRLAFLAFDPTFRGGIEVAAGDITGDGIPEILVTGGCAGPFVRAFDGRTGALVREYTVAGPVWSCGFHLAAGDVNGDGFADLVLGSGGISAPFVQVISGASGAVLRDFYAYELGFTGGVYVAAADVTGDGFADIVTGAGPGGGPHVRVFDGATGAAIGGPLAGFMAYDPAFGGGVRVAAGDLNGDGRAEVITGTGAGGGPHVRVWDGATATEVFGLLAFDPAFTGGVFVAAPPATSRMTIDLATTTGGAIRIAGWALREGLGNTAGTDAVHAWAFPVGGGSPVFVGATLDRAARPDVAAALGGEFLRSGFDITGSLAPGIYDLVVYVRNSRTHVFDQARVVRLTVN